MRPYIQDVYPLQAQFLCGQMIRIAVELYNPSAMPQKLNLIVKVIDLTVEIEQVSYITALHPEWQETIQIAISSKNEEFKGYGVDAYLYEGDELLHVLSSSFDVVSDWRKSTRYGFLSDFHPRERGDAEDVKLMNKLHLNLVQFYDWAYRHDNLVSPIDTYSDLMGKVSSLEVIQEKIALCHQYGMKAMAYGAVYAASRQFYEQHKDWALYDSSGQVLDFIEVFIIMNIAEESPWHKHIIEQYKKSVALLQFDGIHMDTYGSPKTAISRLHNKDQIVRMEEHFPVLINHTRDELGLDGQDICLIFNNVGNWPVESVARAEQDVIYIEVWKPYERYHHIQQIIRWAQYWGGGKPVILAAYLKPFMEKGEGTVEKANFSALLLTAVIAANGGYHLLMGEEKGILTQGYYVDYSTLSDRFLREIRNYYDFNIRYASLLFDTGLKDVSMTHADGDNLEYVFDNASYSTYGEPGKVWTIMREKPGTKTINLINLCGITNDLWNIGKEKPLLTTDLSIRVLLEADVKSVFIASPDVQMGRPQRVEYSVETGKRGKTLAVTLPELHVWALLVIYTF